MKTIEIECAVARYFNPRINLIVPNISWGLDIHECDLLVLTQAGYLYEIEIKTTISDTKRDKTKMHGHQHPKIKRLYFAIPHKIINNAIYHIPPRAGIISCVEIKDNIYVDIVRQPESNGNYTCTEKEKFQIARLGALRIWNLKQKLINQK